MLAIRMQRTGRRGHAQFRVIVQDARKSPTSGKLVAHLGHYNPHTKSAVIDKERAAFYLEHGAQPTPRVIGVLKSEKVTLPKWVSEPAQKKRAIRNIEKLRRNRPADVAPAKAPADTAEKPSSIDASSEAVAETTETQTAPENEDQKPADNADDPGADEKTPKANDSESASKEIAPAEEKSA